MNRLRVALSLAASLLLAGCDTLGYYGQAVSGQLNILLQRRAIPSLLAEPATPLLLREQLQQVQALREFAQDSLQLPVGRQFSSYVDVKAPYVVWNVFAAPEFSLEPLTWCFPVAGCVAYRGYFSEAAARGFAEVLRVEGYDVHVGGVTAYSTLGWFADPVLNTVIGREPWQVASLIFHELAHQLVYVPGDTVFNESFATTVERHGLQRWLQQTQDAAMAQDVLMRAAADQEQRARFVALVQAAVADLRVLYAGESEPVQLRAAKQARIDLLRMEYRDLQQNRGGDLSYDGWFAQELNNAVLLTVATYNEQVPALSRVLQEECADDLSCFYARARELAALETAARRAALALP